MEMIMKISDREFLMLSGVVVFSIFTFFFLEDVPSSRLCEAVERTRSDSLSSIDPLPPRLSTPFEELIHPLPSSLPRSPASDSSSSDGGW